MPQSTRRRACLAKLETTYGTDATPAAATDAVLCAKIDVEPLNIETVDRELVRPFLGAFEQLIVGQTVKVSVDMELAGFGTAGPAAPTAGYDALLRACALARTITATTKVDYTLISTAFESVTIYFFRDGSLHKALGCRGTVSLSLERDKVPLYKFELMGVYGGISDAALVAPVVSAYQRPMSPRSGATTLATFLGVSTNVVLESLNIQLGNNTVYLDRINSAEQINITDRDVSGSFVAEATTVASKDWWSLVRNGTLSAIDLTHGTVAGNKVQITAPRVQMVNPKLTEQDSFDMISADLRFVPSDTGNDEIKITVL